MVVLLIEKWPVLSSDLQCEILVGDRTVLSMLAQLSDLFTLFHESERSPVALLFILHSILQYLGLLLGEFCIQIDREIIG